MAFSRTNRIHIGFLVEIRNHRPKVDPCAKFQQKWTKSGQKVEDLEIRPQTKMIVTTSS